MKLTAPREPWLERYRREFFGDLSLAEAVAEVMPAEECFFFAASAGIVLGLRLADGAQVALKAVHPRPGLAESVAVQAALHRRRFPCPRPLSGPHSLSSGSLAVVQEWVEASQRDVHEPA